MKRFVTVLNLITAGIIGLWCMLPFILSRTGCSVCDADNSAVIGGTAGPSAIFVSPEAGIAIELIAVFTVALLLFNVRIIRKEIEPESERH